MRREGTYLRYIANVGALQPLLASLCAECCTRNKVLKPARRPMRVVALTVMGASS